MLFWELEQVFAVRDLLSLPHNTSLTLRASLGCGSGAQPATPKLRTCPPLSYHLGFPPGPQRPRLTPLDCTEEAFVLKFPFCPGILQCCSAKVPSSGEKLGVRIRRLELAIKGEVRAFSGR